MKIKSIETFTREPISIVRAQTNDGAEGWGQISPYNADISGSVMHRQITPHDLSVNAFDIDNDVEKCI